MICDFSDDVVVPFPLADIAADKRRPSLVLSNRPFNDAHGHSICAMITTAARSNWPSNVVIEDLKPAGLNRPCVVRWKLFTLPNGLILRRAGQLGEHDRERIVSVARHIML